MQNHFEQIKKYHWLQIFPQNSYTPLNWNTTVTQLLPPMKKFGKRLSDVASFSIVPNRKLMCRFNRKGQLGSILLFLLIHFARNTAEKACDSSSVRFAKLSFLCKFLPKSMLWVSFDFFTLRLIREQQIYFLLKCFFEVSYFKKRSPS